MSSDDEVQYASEENSICSDGCYTDYQYSEDDDVNEGDNYLAAEDETNCVKKTLYNVLSDADIIQLQEDAIMEVSGVLSVSRAAASFLLCRYHWNATNVTDAWFADEEKVRKNVGLLEEPVVCIPDSMEVMCKICFESYRRNAMPAASCGHPFCATCWEGYIGTAIKDGSGCLVLHCPEPSCKAAIDQDMINSLVCEENCQRYAQYLLNSYVEESKELKWCPAPGCEFSVEMVRDSESYDVICKCAHTFCWNCSQDAHRPVDCDTVKNWILKNCAESNNTTWLFVNTKPCPKCNRSIEKNQGCMHMTCSLCHYEFCWLCLGEWSKHNDESDDFYKCNTYRREKQEGKHAKTEKKKAAAKRELDRFTHFYERWAANQKSREKAIADLHKMRTVHVDKLRESQCKMSSELNFIGEAWKQIVECRRMLKWSYAYGYFIPENEPTKKQLFEHLQCGAESALERLHECAEKELQVFLYADKPSEEFNAFRTKLAGLTMVTKNYFENLVHALANDLDDVEVGASCAHRKVRAENLLDKEDEEDVGLGILFKGDDIDVHDSGTLSG